VSVLYSTRAELDARLPELRELPTDAGTLELIVVRPSEGERETPPSGEITLEEGLVGDHWEPFVERDGSLGRKAQLTIASTHLLGLIAEPERWALAGDNLLVDMGLDAESLPVGSRLAIGDEVVVEISDLPHTGCAKFSARFGSDALKFINSPEGRQLRLRGVNAFVVEPGTVSVGDAVRRV
jgi:MOSC domain-containing protein YiiM